MTERQLVTIISEPVIEKKLVEDVKACGAKGHSIAQVHGEGVTGNRSLELIGPSIRLETVVDDETADRILEMLDREYLHRYAVVVWVTPTKVARPDRF